MAEDVGVEEEFETLPVKPSNPLQVFHSDPFLNKNQNKTLKTRERKLDKKEGKMKDHGAFVISLRGPPS